MSSMFFLRLLVVLVVLLCALSSTSTSASASSEQVCEQATKPTTRTPPYINGSFTFLNTRLGKPQTYNPTQYSDNVDVIVTSPILDTVTNEPIVIGTLARLTMYDIVLLMDSSKQAWNHGQGVWPRKTQQQRTDIIETIVKEIQGMREEIAETLMWEISKTKEDSLLEVDRTIEFIRSVIVEYKRMDDSTSWQQQQQTYARVRRSAVGITLCAGPWNYPFNEIMVSVLPALLVGNVVILQLPTIGSLSHMLLAKVYEKYLPEGVLNYINNQARLHVPQVMNSDIVDQLVFIGGSKTADHILTKHPSPHRLKTLLQLEGKNVGVVLADADMKVAVEQTVLGSLSFNGQRCTAIKLIFVHESIATSFVSQFVARVQQLKHGLPWEANVTITPLAEGARKIEYLQSLIADSVVHGGRVVNQEQGGGTIVNKHTMIPAVVFPVTSAMRLWHEEQFGPVVPIAVYSTITELESFFASAPVGLQASLFSSDATTTAPLVDLLATSVGRINLNTQCSRSPDALPFSGRRSSALGTMSISEIIRELTIETVVATKATNENIAFTQRVEAQSQFLQPLQP